MIVLYVVNSLPLGLAGQLAEAYACISVSCLAEEGRLLSQRSFHFLPTAAQTQKTPASNADIVATLPAERHFAMCQGLFL